MILDKKQNQKVETLKEIQNRVLWLATNMIHHANHVRPNPDGSKVGGHQASSASMVTIMTALYFHFLNQNDLVSVKPHASPVFHAIQYLLGQISRDYMPTLRQFGGLQAYPSRTKDPDAVNFSTGSVGLGAVAPAFMALVGKYASSHFEKQPDRRYIAIIGDAELDEGNVWEAILDDSLNSLGNVLLIVDLNRQSLDRVVPGIKAARLKSLFSSCDWQVLEAKFGKRLQAIFERPNGRLLQLRIDEMSNSEYQGMLRKPGVEIRPLLTQGDATFEKLIADVSDDELPSLLGDLGGHDFDELLGQLRLADQETTRPTVLFAYTVKGWGLPMAGHPLNHSMLLDPKQIDQLRVQFGMEHDEWATLPTNTPAGKLCQERGRFLFPESERKTAVSQMAPPENFSIPTQGKASTQQSFGRILLALSREEALAKHLVTISPDVSVSTNLSGWINKFGVFSLAGHEAGSAATWNESDKGQHIELGISEMNLFMALSMFGISAELLDQLIIPIGTVYDPFVCRGLDAFIYGLYSGSKFIIAGTPSGVTLSPEGGAHQSAVTSSLGMELPNLNYFEPCFAMELAWLMVDAVMDCFDREKGRASYFRLSTKPIDQRPFHEALTRLGEARLKQQVLAGGYRLHDWRSVEGVDKSYLVHIVTTGAMIPEALDAAKELEGEGIPANVINLTSPRRLFEAWRTNQADSPFEWLIPQNEHHAPLVIVNDGASHAHAWLGSVFGSPIETLGVDKFGQSGSRELLYEYMGINKTAIVDAAMRALNKQGLV